MPDARNGLRDVEHCGVGGVDGAPHRTYDRSVHGNKSMNRSRQGSRGVAPAFGQAFASRGGPETAGPQGPQPQVPPREEKRFCVQSRSARGKRRLVSRHLATISQPSSSLATRNAHHCATTLGFTQKDGTCWLNSILNAIFLSDLGSKLTRALYFDWVIGVRAGRDVKRNRILDHLRLMVDLSAARVPDKDTKVEEDFPERPIRPESLIGKLHRWSPAYFPNVGRNKGYHAVNYIKNFLIFAGVPTERILFLHRERADTRDDGNAHTWYMLHKPFQTERQMRDLLEAKLERRLTPPIVVLVSAPPGSCAAPERLGPLGEYRLDACTASSVWGQGKSGHAVAGITCGGRRRFLFDSNPYRQDKRVVEYDWAGERESEVMLSRRRFQALSSSRVLVYYNAKLLQCLYGRSRAIAEEWLSIADDYHPDPDEDVYVPEATLKGWARSLRACR